MGEQITLMTSLELLPLYVVLQVMLGITLGSVSFALAKHDHALPDWAYSLKNWKTHCASNMDAVHLCGSLAIGVGFAVACFVGYGKPGTELAVMYITIATIGYSAVYDFQHRAVYPITHVVALVAVLKTFTTNEVWLLVVTYAAFLVTSKLLKGKMGEGDFDVAFLILISNGYMAVFKSVFIASTAGLIAVLPLIVMGKWSRERELPFVPFLYIGYIVQLII